MFPRQLLVVAQPEPTLWAEGSEAGFASSASSAAQDLAAARDLLCSPGER